MKVLLLNGSPHDPSKRCFADGCVKGDKMKKTTRKIISLEEMYEKMNPKLKQSFRVHNSIKGLKYLAKKLQSSYLDKECF